MWLQNSKWLPSSLAIRQKGKPVRHCSFKYRLLFNILDAENNHMKKVEISCGEGLFAFISAQFLTRSCCLIFLSGSCVIQFVLIDVREVIKMTFVSCFTEGQEKNIRSYLINTGCGFHITCNITHYDSAELTTNK